MFNFSKYYLGLLNSEYVSDAYFEKYPQNQQKYKTEILNLFKTAWEERNVEKLRAVIALADLDGVDSSYTSILLDLLNEHWHDCHEDIVMLLLVIKDPTSVQVLYEIALTGSTNDEFGTLSKKSIWALGAINTPEAHQKLLLLKDTDDPVIKEAAVKQLNHKSK